MKRFDENPTPAGRARSCGMNTKMKIILTAAAAGLLCAAPRALTQSSTATVEFTVRYSRTVETITWRRDARDGISFDAPYKVARVSGTGRWPDYYNAADRAATRWARRYESAPENPVVIHLEVAEYNSVMEGNLEGCMFGEVKRIASYFGDRAPTYDSAPHGIGMIASYVRPEADARAKVFIAAAGGCLWILEVYYADGFEAEASRIVQSVAVAAEQHWAHSP